MPLFPPPVGRPRKCSVPACCPQRCPRPWGAGVVPAPWASVSSEQCEGSVGWPLRPAAPQPHPPAARPASATLAGAAESAPGQSREGDTTQRPVDGIGCHLGLRQVFSQTSYKHGRGQAVTSLGTREKTNRAPPHCPTGRTGGGGGCRGGHTLHGERQPGPHQSQARPGSQQGGREQCSPPAGQRPGVQPP